MSAWIVSKLHIDVVVQALTQGEIVVDRTADEVGQALWQENLNSIHYRYEDTAETHSDYPGPVSFKGPKTVAAYRYAPPTPGRLKVAYNHQYYRLAPGEEITLDALLKVVGCYEYQTCEHPEWEASEAFKWVEVLTDNLLRAGATRESEAYNRAPWGL